MRVSGKGIPAPGPTPASKPAATAKLVVKSTAKATAAKAAAAPVKRRAQAAGTGDASSAAAPPSVDPSGGLAALSLERAVAPASTDTFAAENGEVVVRYNHYNKAFPIAGGRLSWADVDDEYALSFVFKGAFGKRLVHPASGATLLLLDERWSGLRLGEEYRVHIDEDEAATSAAPPSRPYVPVAAASGLSGRVMLAGSNGEGLFADSSSCSCLYGNPCVSSYNCSDWHNRLDVARRNGWKGFS
jgi:hypothetical protein